MFGFPQCLLALPRDANTLLEAAQRFIQAEFAFFQHGDNGLKLAEIRFKIRRFLSGSQGNIPVASNPASTLTEGSKMVNVMAVYDISYSRARYFRTVSDLGCDA